MVRGGVTTAAVDQLRDELGAQAASWGALLGTDVLQELTRRVDERADRVVAALDAKDPGTAVDVLGVLHPDDVPARWWRTPLGRLIAWAGGMTGGSVTQAEAARLLGVTRPRIHALIAEGKLTPTVQGGVALDSVAARLAAR